MVKEYERLIYTLVSSNVELLPQAYSFSTLPLFLYGNSFPGCIREGNITMSNQLIILFIQRMGPLGMPAKVYEDNSYDFLKDGRMSFRPTNL